MPRNKETLKPRKKLQFTPKGKKVDDVKLKNPRRSTRKSVESPSTSLSRNYPIEYLPKSKQSSILDYQSRLSSKKTVKAGKQQHNSEVKKLTSNTTKQKENVASLLGTRKNSNEDQPKINSKPAKNNSPRKKNSKISVNVDDLTVHVEKTKVKSKARKNTGKHNAVNDKTKAGTHNVGNSEVKTPKRHDRSLSVSKQENADANTRKRKAVYELSPEMKKTKFYDDNVTKWQTLNESTEVFIVKLVDSGIQNVLSKARRSEDFSTIEKCLESCRRKLSEKVKTLKVPHNGFGDYRKLNKLTADYKEMLGKLTDQEQKLDEAVKQEETDYIELRKQESRHGHEDASEALEAFRDYSHQLGVPKLPKFKSMLPS